MMPPQDVRSSRPRWPSAIHQQAILGNSTATLRSRLKHGYFSATCQVISPCKY